MKSGGFHTEGGNCFEQQLLLSKVIEHIGEKKHAGRKMEIFVIG